MAVLPWQSKLILSYPRQQCIIKNNSRIRSVIMADSLSILSVVSIHTEICLPRISFIHYHIIQSKITKFLTAHVYTYCTFIHHWLYAALVFLYPIQSAYITVICPSLKHTSTFLYYLFKRKCKYTDCMINASLFCFGKQVIIHWQIPS